MVYIIFLFYYYLFILITQARLCFRMMAVIYTDVGLYLKCLPQISRQPNYAPSSSNQLYMRNLIRYIRDFQLAIFFINYGLILPVRSEPTAYFTLELRGACQAK